jgi:hypothetical protein
MDRKPERKGEAPEAMRALNRELFAAIAEFQEEKAKTASDPKDRADHERLAQVSRKALRDWE